MSWGDVFGKIFDWIPGRMEHIKNQIDKLEKEQDGLTKQSPSGKNVIRMVRIADELRVLYARLKNNAK